MRECEQCFGFTDVRRANQRQEVPATIDAGGKLDLCVREPEGMRGILDPPGDAMARQQLLCNLGDTRTLDLTERLAHLWIARVLMECLLGHRERTRAVAMAQS